MQIEGTDAACKGCGEHNAGSDKEQTEKNVSDAGHEFEQLLPFCVVIIWSQNNDASRTMQKVVRLFEKREQQHFQISEKIKEKVLARERVLSRLHDLKNTDTNKLNASVDRIKNIMKHLYLAQDKLSFANEAQRGRTSLSFSADEKLDNHKLNFRMLHKSKTLAEEKQVLREINVTKHKDAPSTSPLTELGEIIICDELMEMRTKKRKLETKIRQAEKELQAKNEEIWSFQTHLKEKHCKNEASLFVLKETKGVVQDYWVLKWGNLEYESIHDSIISSRKSTLEHAWFSLIRYK
ncbi:hypothetical protein RIF29_38766 [Crotalaria pallida]|uniref:Uncharacterized protein n=1 Tax=Crotalaria pallida TaxID=3830 RepID=A0AAN9E0T8_CROPI